MDNFFGPRFKEVAHLPFAFFQSDGDKKCIFSDFAMWTLNISAAFRYAFAASLAAVRQSVCERARPKGIGSAADSARSVAPIEMKLGTELHLLAG